MRKFLIITILIITFVPLIVWAEGGPAKDLSPSAYLLHLYYDNGQLAADRDFKYKYDILIEEFQPENYTTASPYKGEIINFKNEVAAVFKFDPQKDDSRFTKGKISVKAPYFADANNIVFYNSQNQVLLTISVSDSSFCNDDGVCNSDVGENYTNCSNDCKGSVLSVSPTPSPSASPASIPTKNNLFLAAIYLIIGIGAAIIGWVLWRKWRKNEEEQQQIIDDKQIKL